MLNSEQLAELLGSHGRCGDYDLAMRWFGKAPEAVKGFMAWVGFVSWFFAIPIGGAMMAYLLSLFQRVPPWGIALVCLIWSDFGLLICNFVHRRRESRAPKGI